MANGSFGAFGSLLGQSNDPFGSFFMNPVTQFGMNLLGAGPGRTFGQALGVAGQQTLENLARLQDIQSTKDLRDIQKKQLDVELQKQEEEQRRMQMFRQELEQLGQARMPTQPPVMGGQPTGPSEQDVYQLMLRHGMLNKPQEIARAFAQPESEIAGRSGSYTKPDGTKTFFWFDKQGNLKERAIGKERAPVGERTKDPLAGGGTTTVIKDGKPVVIRYGFDERGTYKEQVLGEAREDPLTAVLRQAMGVEAPPPPAAAAVQQPAPQQPAPVERTLAKPYERTQTLEADQWVEQAQRINPNMSREEIIKKGKELGRLPEDYEDKRTSTGRIR